MPASQTAPVRRSSTVTPSWPGSVRTSLAAAARPCWSGQPQLPQSGVGPGVVVGLRVAVRLGVAPVRASPARFPATAGALGPAAAGAGAGPPPRASATIPAAPATTSTTSSATSRHRREERSGAGWASAGEATRWPVGRPRAVAPAGRGPRPRRAVPGQVPAGDERDVEARELLGAVGGRERVRLVRQHDQVRAGRDLVQGHPGVALGPARRTRSRNRVGEHVAGEGVRRRAPSTAGARSARPRPASALTVDVEDQTRRASSSHGGDRARMRQHPRRRLKRLASVRGAVTQTANPSAAAPPRRRAGSPPRWPARGRARAPDAVQVRVLGPPTRATSRSAGWVQ